MNVKLLSKSKSSNSKCKMRLLEEDNDIDDADEVHRCKRLRLSLPSDFGLPSVLYSAAEPTSATFSSPPPVKMRRTSNGAGFGIDDVDFRHRRKIVQRSAESPARLPPPKEASSVPNASPSDPSLPVEIRLHEDLVNFRPQETLGSGLPRSLIEKYDMSKALMLYTPPTSTMQKILAIRKEDDPPEREPERPQQANDDEQEAMDVDA